MTSVQDSEGICITVPNQIRACSKASSTKFRASSEAQRVLVILHSDPYLRFRGLLYSPHSFKFWIFRMPNLSVTFRDTIYIEMDIKTPMMYAILLAILFVSSLVFSLLLFLFYFRYFDFYCVSYFIYSPIFCLVSCSVR